jgi:hypothetical protein
VITRIVATRNVVGIGLILAVASASSARAEERYDHRGAVGLLVSTGGSTAARVGFAQSSDLHPGFIGELGGTFAAFFELKLVQL